MRNIRNLCLFFWAMETIMAAFGVSLKIRGARAGKGVVVGTFMMT